MKYEIINNSNFELNTIVYNNTFIEDINNIEEYLNNYLIKEKFVFLYEKNTNIKNYEELRIDNTLYDITYIDKNGYMYSVLNLNIIQLTLKLEELTKTNNIEKNYLNIFNIKDRKILK